MVNRTTHTYAILDVSARAFAEIKSLLTSAGYEHAFHDDVIDMQGIAVRGKPTATPADRHCPSCICGKRARVQGNARIPVGQPGHGPGTIAWAEHELAWSAYAAQFGRDQSAERMNDRGGFCYLELTQWLGRAPQTWVPAGTVAERER